MRKGLAMIIMMAVIVLPIMAAAETKAPEAAGVQQIMEQIRRSQNVTKNDQIDCSKVTAEQLKQLGQAVAAGMYPDNQSRNYMNNMMGGENTAMSDYRYRMIGAHYLGCYGFGGQGHHGKGWWGNGMMGHGMMGRGMMGPYGYGLMEGPYGMMGPMMNMMMDGFEPGCYGHGMHGRRNWNMMPYGYGGWMGHGFFGPFGWLILLIVLVIIVYVIVKAARGGYHGTAAGENALDILKKRYARGEITKEQFDKMKEDLK